MKHVFTIVAAVLLLNALTSSVQAQCRRMHGGLFSGIESAVMEGFEQSPIGQASRFLEDLNRRLDAADRQTVEKATAKKGNKTTEPVPSASKERKDRVSFRRKMVLRRLVFKLRKRIADKSNAERASNKPVPEETSPQ